MAHCRIKIPQNSALATTHGKPPRLETELSLIAKQLASGSISQNTMQVDQMQKHIDCIRHVMAPKSKVCQRREYSKVSWHTSTRIRTIEPSSNWDVGNWAFGRFGSSFWRLTSNSPSVLFYCYPSKILVIFHVVNPIKNHPQVRSRHNALFLTFGTSASSLAALPGETERSALLWEKKWPLMT